MPIQLPPEIAMQMQSQMQQKNQLYTLAFEIFKELIYDCDLCTKEEVGKKTAKLSIHYAKDFMEVVQEDQKNG